MARVNDNKIVEWICDGVELSTDRNRFDIDKIHDFLSAQSYWAQGQSRETLIRSIDNSMALGLYSQGQQIGFARIVTDFTRLAYLMDIFIDQVFRGRSLGSGLSETVRSHPYLASISKWMLVTCDAQQVYQRAGWDLVKHPECIMEISPSNPAGQPAVRVTDTFLSVKHLSVKEGMQ